MCRMPGAVTFRLPAHQSRTRPRNPRPRGGAGVVLVPPPPPPPSPPPPPASPPPLPLLPPSSTGAVQYDEQYDDTELAASMYGTARLSSPVRMAAATSAAAAVAATAVVVAVAASRSHPGVMGLWVRILNGGPAAGMRHSPGEGWLGVGPH
ncbi:hypothetical protein PLESTF_001179700 [Pleodorina starrii]|nr:hypothetical protein PLESTF_001179700 [Pleodorina starrii]